jgi:hypothetical protein
MMEAITWTGFGQRQRGKESGRGNCVNWSRMLLKADDVAAEGSGVRRWHTSNFVVVVVVQLCKARKKCIGKIKEQ